jgi:hypothetical protein
LIYLNLDAENQRVVGASPEFGSGTGDNANSIWIPLPWMPAPLRALLPRQIHIGV